MKCAAKRIISVLLSLIILIGLTAGFTVFADNEPSVKLSYKLDFESDDKDLTFTPSVSDYYNFNSGDISADYISFGLSRGNKLLMSLYDADSDGDSTVHIDGSFYLDEGVEYTISSFAYDIEFQKESNDEHSIVSEFVKHSITVTSDAMSIEPTGVDIRMHSRYDDKIYVGETLTVTANIIPTGANIRSLTPTISDESVIVIDRMYIDIDMSRVTTFEVVGKGTSTVTFTEPESGITAELEITVKGGRFEFAMRRLGDFIKNIIKMIMMWFY